MNTVPEWFTVEPDRTPYLVRDMAKGKTQVISGAQLHGGLPVRAAPGETLRLVVQKK